MKETLDLFDVLTNAAPLVLSTIILAAALLTFLWVMIKIIVPAMQEMNQTFHIQRQSWKALIDEQNRINERLTKELQADLAIEKAERIKLERRVEESERELKEKTRQLDEANRRIQAMQGELNEEKLARQKITRERDDLRLEVNQLHAEVAQLRAQLNDMPKAETASDGKNKPPAPKEGEGEKKV